MPRNISSLKGWTIAKVTYSAGYYTLELTRGSQRKTLQVGADQVFDNDGERFENNLQ